MFLRVYPCGSPSETPRGEVADHRFPRSSEGTGPRQRRGWSTVVYIMYIVYIIQSQRSGRYYVGSTSDLQKRIQYHNVGKNRSTRLRGPWSVVYSEQYSDKQSALARERQIKSWKGGVAFKKLIKTK